jgi:hypothetical protein
MTKYVAQDDEQNIMDYMWGTEHRHFAFCPSIDGLPMILMSRKIRHRRQSLQSHWFCLIFVRFCFCGSHHRIDRRVSFFSLSLLSQSSTI